MLENSLRVAVYCRVASADQLALEAQKDSLLLYTKENGLDKYGVDTYMDNGYSGLNFDRPAFSKMEEAIRTGIIGAILVKDMSRIGRGFLETGEWLHRRRADGIAIIEAHSSIKDNIVQNKGCFQKFIEGGADHGRKDNASRKVRQKSFRR